MNAGIGAARRRAGPLLARHPVAWLPPLLCHAPLLLGWVALVAAGLSPSGLAGLSQVERHRLWLALLPAALGLLLMQRIYDAAYLHVADRLLREERASWADLWHGVRRLTPRLLLGRLGLTVVHLALLVATTLAVASLLCAARPELLGELLTGQAGRAEIVAAWRERGLIWLVGSVALLAGLMSCDTMVRMAGTFWRASLVTEDVGPGRAVAQSVQFVYGQGCLVIGRAWWYRLTGCAVLVPVLVGGLVLRGELAGLADLDAASAVVLGRLGTWLWLAGLAGAYALLAASRTITDLALYRLRGGPGADPALVTRGVRPRRRREGRGPRQPGAGLTVASEPAAAGHATWTAGPASEPLPSGRIPARPHDGAE